MWPYWEWKVGGNVLSRYGVDDPDSKDYVKKENSYDRLSGHEVGGFCRGEYADRTRGQKNLTILRYGDVL